MKNNSLITKLAAAACALTLVATPAVAFAQPATTESTPVVAQGVYDYTDSILIALADSGYSPYVADVTDLDTYVNEYGALVDYVAFNVGGMRFQYEVDCIDGTIWYKDVFI
jgi:hypothetical protein